MGRIRNAKLKKSLFLHLVLFLTIGIILSIFVGKLCNKIQEDVWLRNLENIDEYTQWQEKYTEQFSDFLPIPSSALGDLETRDRITIEICDFIESWSLFFFAFGGALVAVIVFYDKKLKRPLALLNNGAQEIGKHNLDFELIYDRSDEMGELCEAFEKMRLQLVENNSYMWKMIEEQKQIRAAFSHDIRAPLAVLKGYVQLLLKYLPEKRISSEKQVEILKDIEEQVNRLEAFSDTIKKVNRLDNISITKEKTNSRTVFSKIEKSLSLLNEQFALKLKYEYKCPEIDSINIDTNMLLEVVENIFLNAVRYAKTEVGIEMQKVNDKYLKVIVSDDGRGFSENDIVNGCKLYYHDEFDSDITHYGMGLYICEMLCKKHGGEINLGNNISGGACVQVTFSVE